MRIFDIFRSAWSSNDMTQDDRNKVFWYLKRRTSYTTWAIEAELFDRFATVYERQVREQPVAPSPMGGSDWGILHARVLTTQKLYGQGLTRLRQGDRSVFLSDSPGPLAQAREHAGYWYTELINNGMRGDHFYYGKYLPELESRIREFSRPRLDHGLVQDLAANSPAPELWGSTWRPELDTLPFPRDLPDVSRPNRELLVRTGGIIPMFGIYEPQIRDGCMNYLMKDAPAPTVWATNGVEATGGKRAVNWRLIWEDTRYLDGTILAEERHYFPAWRCGMT